MPIGEKARNPNTIYVVYEFSVADRVYYVGIGQKDSIRATDRWNYISRQIERLKKEGRLPPGKMQSLKTCCGAVIRALIESGYGPHKVSCC